MKHSDVLIVDDEQRFADMLAKRLSLRGIACDVCYRGRDALELLKQREFGLVLLDLHLPDIYGIDVLAGIMQIRPRTPVVVITGHGSENDRERCAQLGTRAFMHKPVGIDELVDIWDRIREKSP